MKHFLFTVTALAIFSLLAPISSFAQIDHNEIGVYTDPEMTDVSTVVGVWNQIEVYVVLSNPYDDETGFDVSAIGGVEFRFVLDNGNIDMSTIWDNPYHIDIGSPAEGHVCGFSVPSPVVDGSVLICTKNILIVTDEPSFVFLTTVTNNANFPGQMGYVNSDIPWDHNLMFPTSGAHEDPVFSFNGYVLPTVKFSIDQVKALYR